MDGELVAEAYQRTGLLDDSPRRQAGRLPAVALCKVWPRAESGYALGPELVLRDADRAVDWERYQPATRLSLAEPAALAM